MPPWVRRFPGAGAPALLIHCSLAHSGAWSGVASGLTDRLDMVAVDLPGHGRAPARDPAMDAHDEATALAREGCPEGAHVIGHSFGATVALRLALEGAVRSLVLIEPVLFAAAREAGDPAYAAHRAEHAPIMAAFAVSAETAARDFHALWGDGRPWDDLPEAQRTYMTERIGVIPASEPALDGDRAGLLASGRLEALAIPVLLLEGMLSPPVIAATQKALAGRLPRARRHVVAGAGHMVPITHAAVVAQEIRSHLDAA